jgi:hypothetical protein
MSRAMSTHSYSRTYIDGLRMEDDEVRIVETSQPEVWSLGHLSEGTVHLEWLQTWKNEGLSNAPAPRTGGVFVEWKHSLVFLGGRNSNNGSLGEKSFHRAFLYHLKEGVWESKGFAAQWNGKGVVPGDQCVPCSGGRHVVSVAVRE